MTESVTPGRVELSGKTYMPDAKGSLVPIELVKDEHRLQDDLVRELFAEAARVSDQLRAFKLKAFSEVETFLELVASKYGAKARPGGDKGNVTLQSYDGTVRVQVQIADLVRFDDAGLQATKALVQEFLADETGSLHPDLRGMLLNAFRVDGHGNINRGALLGCLRVEWTDERLVRAMTALKDAIRPDGTKPYIRFHKRAAADQAWETLSLDVATA